MMFLKKEKNLHGCWLSCLVLFSSTVATSTLEKIDDADVSANTDVEYSPPYSANNVIGTDTVAVEGEDTMWEIYSNQNNVYGKVTAALSDGRRVKYLGTYKSMKECWRACNESMITKQLACSAFTWHPTSFGGAFSGGCYFTMGGEWSPTSQKGVISGRGPTHKLQMDTCKSFVFRIQHWKNIGVVNGIVNRRRSEVPPYLHLLSTTLPLADKSCLGFARNTTFAPIVDLRGRDLTMYTLEKRFWQRHLKNYADGIQFKSLSSLVPMSWTLSLWFRMDEPCRQHKCMLVHRLHPDGLSFQTPTIFVDMRQRLSVITTKSTSIGIVSMIPGRVRTNVWCNLHFYFSATDDIFQACTKCGLEPPKCSARIGAETILSDSFNSENWIVGGSDEDSMARTFTGFINDVRLYKFHALIELGTVEDAFSMSRIGHSATNLALPLRSQKSALRRRLKVDSCKHPVLKFVKYNGKCPKQNITCLTLIRKFRSKKARPKTKACPARFNTWDALGKMYSHSASQRTRYTKLSWESRVLRQHRVVTSNWTKRAITIFEQSNGESELLPRAIRLLNLAASFGNADALYFLATLEAAKTSTVGESHNLLGHKLLLLAASRGSALAQLAVANRFRHGINVRRDEEIAYGLYHCHAGLGVQQMHAGTQHHQTNLIRLDDNLAISAYGGETGEQFEWVKRLAVDGEDTAMVELGGIYYWGGRGVVRDIQAAFKWFERAARLGNGDALYTLGVMHRNGEGTDANASKMLEYFSKAAQMNNSAAFNGLGVYWLTEGKNITKALQYFEFAQRSGSADGAFNLGTLRAHMHSDTSQLGPKNMTAATESWKFAAERGHHHAKRFLAKQLSDGIWIPQNMTYAIELLAETSQMQWAVGDILHEAISAHIDPFEDHAIKSQLKYMLAGEAGIQVAQINAAQQQANFWKPHDQSLPLIENHDQEKGFHEQGVGDSKWNFDNFRARIYLRNLHLASHTSPEALTHLGNAYWYGVDGVVQPNRTKAEKYWVSASLQGDTEAHYNLGYLWVTCEGANCSDNIEERLSHAFTHWQRCEAVAPCYLLVNLFWVVRAGVTILEAIPTGTFLVLQEVLSYLHYVWTVLLSEILDSVLRSIEGVTRIIGLGKLF